MIKFIVPGEPKAKARPRVIKNGITYTPKETVEYENWVKMCFVGTGNKAIPEGTQIKTKIICYFGIPKSYSVKKQKACMSGELRPTKKPDMDNIAKAILDSLNGIAYKDDSQIVELAVEKYFDEVPRVEVEIGAAK